METREGYQPKITEGEDGKDKDTPPENPLSEKIDPGWRNDRLPIEDDGDADDNYKVLFSVKNEITAIPFGRLLENQYWTQIKQEYLEMPGHDWCDDLLTHEECGVREKGEELDPLALAEKALEAKGDRKPTRLEIGMLKQEVARLTEDLDLSELKANKFEVKLGLSNDKVRELQRNKDNPKMQMKLLATESIELKEQNEVLWGMVKALLELRLK